MVESNLVDFLLSPASSHSAVEDRLDEFALSELAAVDEYLTERVGAGWVSSKEFHQLDLCDRPWHRLWPARVASRLLLRELARDLDDGELSLLSVADSLLLHRFDVPNIGEIAVVISGGFLNSELTRSHHPSIFGARLFCESPTQGRVSELVERYRLALDLLARNDTQGFATFAGSVSAIVPLQIDPPLEAGKCVSLSIAAAPGVVLMTMVPIILLSETLLHEAAHCRLSAVEDLAPLWVSSSVRVHSPLRPDPRPIAGLFHQTYVLYCLFRYFINLRDASQEPVVLRNQRQIDKRIDELSAGFQDAVATLRANSNELTALGKRIVKEMTIPSPKSGSTPLC